LHPAEREDTHGIETGERKEEGIAAPEVVAGGDGRGGAGGEPGDAARGGFSRGDFRKSQIGVASTWSQVTPCNMHIDRLARQAAKGVEGAGASR
jgi:hypothetical protein